MKAIKLAFGLVAVLFSANVLAQYADTTAMLSAAPDDTNCPPLGAAVTLNTSNGVIAALHCRSIFGDVIAGTCHANGNVTPTTVNCGCGPNTGTPLAPQYDPNISTCPGTCDLQGVYTPQDPNGDSVLVAGRKAFGASTQGGRVAPYSLGDTGLCDAANLPGISLFP